jgi:hypothetical protein
MGEIMNGTKVALYSNWFECYKNVMNVEYWKNNLLKTYIYSIGLFSTIFIPLIFIADCIKPLLGRGPNSKKPEI